MIHARWFSIGVFLFFVLLGYGMLKTIIGLWIREGMPPEYLAEMKAYFNTPVDFPQEYFENRIYPKEIQESGTVINSLYKQAELEKIDFLVLNDLKNGDELLEAEWGQIGNEVQRIQPFLDQLMLFVRMPGFEIGAWPVNKIDPESTIPNYLSIQTSAKALLLRAYSSANQKNWKDAFQANLAAFELTKRNPVGTLIEHLIAIAIQSMSAEVAIRLVHSCDNGETLKNLLLELNRLDAIINLNRLEDILILDLIAGLREFKRTDATIDITPGKPGRFYFRQIVDYTARNERSSVSPEKFPELWIIQVGRFLGFGSEIDTLFYKMIVPKRESARIREATALTLYRMAQLSLASRIEEFATGKTVSRVADLVPTYFQTEPLDPFAEAGKGSAFLYDERRKTFYGIGPDNKDDQNRIIYDPSNGITSVGDISVAW